MDRFITGIKEYIWVGEQQLTMGMKKEGEYYKKSDKNYKLTYFSSVENSCRVHGVRLEEIINLPKLN